ncbi:HAD family hydrolase [Geopsychrobacter electrodiphilus]|uniref:HAD family hydrolase n=1 Tax=Geopsychrobacter electrodiphilus TaxID=225196 RepID=UPI00039EC045|nr:HAD family hydrolase [Geopsychrobacter electrodiphilus]
MAQISEDWHGHSREQIQEYLRPRSELRLQEASKQNTFKLSYYLALEGNKGPVLSWVDSCLNQKGVEASLVWSIDERKSIGLLDVLPRNATKLHGIQFLQQQLGFQQDEVVFAGDSGNDLAVLGSAVPAILVANAGSEVQRQAKQLAVQNGQTDSLYLATEAGSGLGGHYAAGILEGVWHFVPEFRAKLTQMERSL